MYLNILGNANKKNLFTVDTSDTIYLAGTLQIRADDRQIKIRHVGRRIFIDLLRLLPHVQNVRDGLWKCLLN
jgi:hypothetical protein